MGLETHFTSGNASGRLLVYYACPSGSRPRGASLTRLSLRVHPRSSRENVRLDADGSLSVWISAPPVDGKANEATCRLLATRLGVPRSSITLVAGAHGRTKVIEVEGLTEAEVGRRLERS